MSKPIILGLWGCIITLAASYGTMMMAAPVKQHKEEKASYFGGVDYVKAPMVAVPIIKDKKLSGYIVADFVFTIEQKTLHSLSVTPEPFLVDAAFRRLYSGTSVDIGNMKKPNLDKLLSGLRDDVNKRYGKPVIKEVLVERMNFLPLDSVRTGSYETETLAKMTIPSKPAKSGH